LYYLTVFEQDALDCFKSVVNFDEEKTEIKDVYDAITSEIQKIPKSEGIMISVDLN